MSDRPTALGGRVVLKRRGGEMRVGRARRQMRRTWLLVQDVSVLSVRSSRGKLEGGRIWG